MKAAERENQIDDPKMPLTEHLRELRRRMIYTFAGVGIAFAACWVISDYIVAVVKAPVYKSELMADFQFQFDTLTDPFFTHLKAAFFAAVFLTFPFILSQIWLFVRPGLFKREKRVVWPFLIVSYPLFVGGGLFCYLVIFPLAVDFLVGFDTSLVPSLRIGDYLSFTLRLVFVFGLVFELPLISLLLTRMGLLTPEFLTKNWRYVIVIVFIAAAILTPPDPFTQLLLAGPLIVLYGISILVSKLARPKQAPTDDQAP